MANVEARIGQRAFPMICYEDVGKALDWLTRVFGFREVGDRFTDEGGRVNHAEIDLDGGRVMLSWPGSDYQSPARHAQVCEGSRRWLQVPYVIDGVCVFVDDVDSHCERARAGGAKILLEPTTHPYGRLYNAEDHEGHRWIFMRPAET